jgi:uncharacterized membrane protein YedE/YeeE
VNWRFIGDLLGLAAARMAATTTMNGAVRATGSSASEKPLRADCSATASGRAESSSFVGPVANLLEWLVLWTDQSRTLTFGIAAVLDVAAGSAAAAVLTRSFRREGFASVEDLARHIVGGILMGFGGVTALGCTIGQGLTGVSTLTVGSFIALGSIIAGSALTMKYQAWRLERAG